MLTALISLTRCVCTYHCEEHESMKEGEECLLSEDQMHEQTKVHSFLSLDEEDTHCT